MKRIVITADVCQEKVAFLFERGAHTVITTYPPDVKYLVVAVKDLLAR
jgi:hypothetical protein